MALFGKYNGGLMDSIRCDEQSYLIWKWHPSGSVPGKSKRENSIRWGSRLRVREGSVAVFVYSTEEGTFQDFIEGPHDSIIKTQNFPILSSLIGIAYNGNTPFQAEIYFINLAQLIQLKFAIPYFDVFDPRFLDYGVPLSVRGSISFKITNYRDFIKLHRLEHFSMEDFQKEIKDALTRFVKNAVANVPEEHNIPVVQIERRISMLNDIVEKDLRARLFDDFGITVSGLDIASIEIDKSSDGFTKLMAVTQNLTTKLLETESSVKIKEMQDSQNLSIIERTRSAIADIEENRYARHKKTQTENLAAYKTEMSKDVGVAGAEGLGKLGSGGGSNIGSNLNPGGLMAGIAIGSTLGKNIAEKLQDVMNPPIRHSDTHLTPPPVSVDSYYVVISGQTEGPFDIATLSKMINNHLVTKQSLVWKPGMENWQVCCNIQEMQTLFLTTPPPIPTSD